MGPRAVNFSEEDKVILQKVNSLLDQLHVDKPVSSVAEIGGGVFVTLFEGLCGEQLQGINRSPSTREDEVRNCQKVIDNLAGDVLHTSLTHISGADIVDGNRESINNLLEIFTGLLEYMLNKIDSDISTYTEEDEDHNRTAEDPDRMSHDQLDEILDLELRKERLLHEDSAVKNGGPTASWVEDPSPHKPTRQEKKKEGNGKNIDDRDPTCETTADLIKESEEIERRLEETRKIIRENAEIERKIAESKVPAPDTALDITPIVERSVPQPEPRPEQRLQSDRERRAEIIKRLENDSRYQYMLPPTASQTRVADEQSDETFRNLQSMVEETAAMARAAVNCDPDQARNLLNNMENRSPVKGHPGYGRSRISREPDIGRTRTSKRASPSSRRSPKAVDRNSDTELTPSHAKRKVSFLGERSLTDSSVDVSKSSRRPDTYGGSYMDEYTESTSYQDRLRQRYEDIVTDMVSDEELSPDKRRDAARRNKYKEISNTPRALYTLGQTQNMVNKEKNAGKKKIGFLQKIYREDLDELLDEADYLLNKNRETAKDKEKEYRKKMMAGVQTKPVKERQGPSVLKKKARPMQPHVVSSKVRKPASGHNGSIVKPVRKQPLTIQDGDDLLPILLDEFPHLHLSLHTWHELWRKGLQQIEQITRAHQEGKRKKSLAQSQLEEAEKRQEIMVNIVRKELEHEHRLREVKERKASAISSRNKLHERRIQSARSRHYYDEYQVRMRSKMLKRRTREEMVFKKLFQDGLEIQKERIRELRKYAKEHRDSEAKTQRDQIESMENYYRDQFQMLAENISKEKKDLVVREKAQQKVLDSMKKELRKKMEKEIQGLQEQLVRDDDDVYFRQIDSDRVIHDLKLAKYQVRV